MGQRAAKEHYLIVHVTGLMPELWKLERHSGRAQIPIWFISVSRAKHLGKEVGRVISQPWKQVPHRIDGDVFFHSMGSHVQTTHPKERIQNQIRAVPIILGGSPGMGGKTMGCGTGCCKLALMPCNCFIGIFIEVENPPFTGVPKEEPKVSRACSAPPKPRIT